MIYLKMDNISLRQEIQEWLMDYNKIGGTKDTLHLRSKRIMYEVLKKI
jgi:hypothetical protein